MAVQYETVRRQVAISGSVKDMVTRKPLGGVEVVVVSGPPAFVSELELLKKIYGIHRDGLKNLSVKTNTGNDGFFYFMDLPDGNYTVEARCPGYGSRYGKAEKTVDVKRSDKGGVLLSSLEIMLPSSVVRGRVVRAGSYAPVAMAEVRVEGSSECSFTDENGCFILSGLEASSAVPRSLAVSATGYQRACIDVLLASPGDEKEVDVHLAPL